jgi:predicted metal-dependent hydrolase
MKRTPDNTEKTTSNTTWHDADDLRWAVRNWASRIGVKPTRIQIRAMQSKWASISTSGSMTLDLGLLKLPQELGEFVIVHELVHLLAPNHGRVFKSFMHAYLPDWETREKQLQMHYEKIQKKSEKGTNVNTKYI